MQLTATYCCCLAIGLFTICQSADQQFIKIKENERRTESHSISKREEADRLLFPEDNPVNTKQTLRRDVGTQQLNPTPCPNGALYCETADDYPRARVRTLLNKKQSKFILNHFYNEEEDTADVERFGDPDESPLCSSQPKTVYPNKAESKEGVLEFIVNEENYKQGIKVEICAKEGNSCEIPGSLSLGYTSHCRQKHIVRTLVVVNKNVSDLEGFITKPFEFPSCCACMVSMKSDRFGGESNQQLLPTTPASRASSSSKIKG